MNLRRRSAPTTPAVAVAPPTSPRDPVGYTQRMLDSRVAAAARNGIADAQTRRAHALAQRAAQHSQCELTAGELLVLCELSVCVQQLAADRDVWVELPDLELLAQTADDLATRNTRRGYHAFVPIGPLLGCLFGHYRTSGIDMGFPDGEVAWLRTVQAALPSDFNERLGELQQGPGEPGRQRLALLTAAGRQYVG